MIILVLYAIYLVFGAKVQMNPIVLNVLPESIFLEEFVQINVRRDIFKLQIISANNAKVNA